METAIPLTIGLEVYPDTWVSGKHSGGIGASFNYFQRDTEKDTISSIYGPVDIYLSSDYTLLDLFGIYRYEISEGFYFQSTAGLGYYKSDNAEINASGSINGSAEIDGDSTTAFLLSASIRKNFADNQLFLGGGLKYARTLSDLEYTYEGETVGTMLHGDDTMLFVIVGLNF
jgi:hypothetical protein